MATVDGQAGLGSDTYEVHGSSVTRMRYFRSYLVGCVHWILAEVLYSKSGMSAVVVMHLIRESAGLRACSPAILGTRFPEQAKVDPANRGASLGLDPIDLFLCLHRRNSFKFCECKNRASKAIE